MLNVAHTSIETESRNIEHLAPFAFDSLTRLFPGASGSVTEHVRVAPRLSCPPVPMKTDFALRQVVPFSSFLGLVFVIPGALRLCPHGGSH